MLMLGDLLGAARDSAGQFTRWLDRVDPQLADEVRAAAAGGNTTPAAFICQTVAEFSRFADEEDWATLTSSMKEDDDPGKVCLLAMVDWRLNAQVCSSHQMDATPGDATPGDATMRTGHD